MTDSEAYRAAERAEGLYHKAILYAGDKKRSAEFQFTALRDAKLLGQVLGKSESEVQADIERRQA